MIEFLGTPQPNDPARIERMRSGEPLYTVGDRVEVRTRKGGRFEPARVVEVYPADPDESGGERSRTRKGLAHKYDVVFDNGDAVRHIPERAVLPRGHRQRIRAAELASETRRERYDDMYDRHGSRHSRGRRPHHRRRSRSASGSRSTSASSRSHLGPDRLHTSDTSRSGSDRGSRRSRHRSERRSRRSMSKHAIQAGDEVEFRPTSHSLRLQGRVARIHASAVRSERELDIDSRDGRSYSRVPERSVQRVGETS